MTQGVRRGDVPRRVVVLGGVAVALAATLPDAALALPSIPDVDAFTGGVNVVPGGVEIALARAVDSGYSVPLVIAAPGAAAILFVAPQNPTPEVLLARFGPLAGDRRLETRIRLAGTQEVVAVARMEDGSLRGATATVSVTVGGCTT